ncbi:MAG: lactate utilization protein [Chloroflexi bacterium]|nr:lactate utilization protein [Chloroflexota bacterium]
MPFQDLSLDDSMIQKIIAKFKRNNMIAWFVPDRQTALSKALSLIPEGASIGLGDSVALQQIGLLDVLRRESKLGNYRLFDRYRHGISPEGVEDDGLNKYRALTADIFLLGANAVTLDGKLVNIDGAGTRVAPLIFGPKKVIVVVGINKIVRNVEEGLRRIKEVAAPLNAARHASKLPCVRTGKCNDCSSPQRICCYTVIVDKAWGRDKGRINVIIVGEKLGL